VSNQKMRRCAPTSAGSAICSARPSKSLGGERLFATEERVRALCKGLRRGHTRLDEQRLKRLLAGLSLDQAISVNPRILGLLPTGQHC
jgi:hypothetical protein